MYFPEPQTPPQDAEADNRDLLISAMGLQQSLLVMDQYGLLNVMSAVQGAPPHPNPEYRDLIQNNMREMGQGYVLLFYFSIWDHYFNRETSRTILEEWCTPAEALRFRAMKHVRHCIAHSFDGKRATQNRAHFDEEMSGTTPFHGMQFTEETIDLSTCQIATDCRSFLCQLSGLLVERIANDGRP